MHDTKRFSTPPPGSKADGIPAQPPEHVAIRPDFSRERVARPGLAWVLIAMLAVCVGLGALFLIGWTPLEKRKTELEHAADAVKTAAPRVSVIAPKKSSPSSEVLLPGQIQAVRETTIYARTSGYLKHWMVDIGDRVKSGQLLAEIDSPEVDMQLEHDQSALAQSKAALDQANAALKQNEANRDNAKASAELADLTLQRYVSLRASHSVTEQDISEKETAAKVAHSAVVADEAAIVAAQANINSAKANVESASADVRREEVLKSFERVTAPFDGINTVRNIEEGSLIAGGSGVGVQELFHIVCTDPVRVFIDVPQAYAPTIKIGQEVQLIVREFPGKSYAGKVVRTSGAIDATNRTLRTEVHIPNADGQLLAGMYVQVKVVVVREHPSLLLPNSALIVNADGNQVALVRDGRVHFQKIELEADYGPEFGVSAGLSETDAVIANPSERLTVDAAVNIVNPK